MKRLYDKWGAWLVFLAFVPAITVPVIKGPLPVGTVICLGLLLLVQRRFNSAPPREGPSETEKQLERSRVEAMARSELLTTAISLLTGGLWLMGSAKDVRARDDMRCAFDSWCLVLVGYLSTAFALEVRSRPDGPWSLRPYGLMFLWGGALMAADILRRVIRSRREKRS